MIDEAIIVSSPQLETADTVTVYLAFPEEQLVILLKTPTLIPGAAVDVLNCGVVAIAQALEPPLPPPVGFALCADSGIDKSVEQTTAKTTRFIEILIIPSLGLPHEPSVNGDLVHGGQFISLSSTTACLTARTFITPCPVLNAGFRPLCHKQLANTIN